MLLIVMSLNHYLPVRFMKRLQVNRFSPILNTLPVNIS